MPEIGHTMWVCTDCMIKHANDEDPTDPTDCEPWALWEDDDTEITMGLLHSEHECDDPENCDGECERISFTWSDCDGCGSPLGGERHAFTWWEKDTANV